MGHISPFFCCESANQRLIERLLVAVRRSLVMPNIASLVTPKITSLVTPICPQHAPPHHTHDAGDALCVVLLPDSRTKQPFFFAQYGHFAQSSIECVPAQARVGTGVQGRELCVSSVARRCGHEQIIPIAHATPSHP